MNKPGPLFTIPHLVVAIISVAAITLAVLFAVNPIEIANKALDEKLSKLATAQDPGKDCAVFHSCELLPSLINNKCFTPRSFYHKRKAILEDKVFAYQKDSKDMVPTTVCDAKSADWDKSACFVCL